MANWFKVVITTPSYTIPEGKDVAQINFNVGAMLDEGTPDPKFSDRVRIVRLSESDTDEIVSVASGWGNVSPDGTIALQGGTGSGSVIVRVLKTYAPGPWLDVGLKAVSLDGSIAGGSGNFCRIALPASLGPKTSHFVRLSQNGNTLAQGTLPTLAGLLLEVDGVGVWSPGVSPFGSFTGQFG